MSKQREIAGLGCHWLRTVDAPHNRQRIMLAAAATPMPSATVPLSTRERPSRTAIHAVAAHAITQTTACNKATPVEPRKTVGTPATFTTLLVSTSKPARLDGRFVEQLATLDAGDRRRDQNAHQQRSKPEDRAPWPTTENQTAAGMAAGSRIATRNRAGELAPAHHI